MNRTTNNRLANVLGLRSVYGVVLALGWMVIAKSYVIYKTRKTCQQAYDDADKVTHLHIDGQCSENGAGGRQLVGALEAYWTSGVDPSEKLMQHRRVCPLSEK